MNLRRNLSVVITALIVSVALLSIFVFIQSSEMYNLKSELEEERADLIGKTSSLEKELVEIMMEATAMEKRLEDLISSNVQQKDEIELRDEEIAALQMELKEIEIREEEIATLQMELKDARIQISNLNGQIAEYVKQIAAMSLPIDQRHLNTSLFAQQDCTQCHGPVAAQAANNESNTYHNTHLNNRLLDFECANCHKSVDISSSSEDLTRVVDVDTCKKCHTPFPVKSYMQYTAEPEMFARMFPSCTSCHTDWKEVMADASFVNLENVTREDCKTCHLENKIFENERSVTIACSKCH